MQNVFSVPIASSSAGTTAIVHSGLDAVVGNSRVEEHITKQVRSAGVCDVYTQSCIVASVESVMHECDIILYKNYDVCDSG